MATILIIDDDRLVCETISNLVKRLGHQASCAFNLQDGLAAAFSGSFDLVFLDVRLPDGDGLEALPGSRPPPPCLKSSS